MKSLTRFFLAVYTVLLLTPVVVPQLAMADLKLPNYSNNAAVDSEIQSKGKRITDTVSLVVGVISILGILVGAGYMGAGNAERGKQVMMGGVGGIVIASLVFGIAHLAAS